MDFYGHEEVDLCYIQGPFLCILERLLKCMSLINFYLWSLRCYHVVAIEIDPLKVDMAINNAKIYGVEDYIDFIVGDFFQLAPSLKVLLSYLY